MNESPFIYREGIHSMSAGIPPWLSHYEKEVPASLDYPDIPLHTYLENAYNRYPDHTAIYFMGKTMTYRELFHDTQLFSRVLQQLGVKKGDRVAIMLPNCPQAVIAYYAVLHIGAVAVLTNPMYKKRELEHQLADSGAKIIVCLDLVYNNVISVFPRTDLEHIVVTGIKDYLPFPKNVLYSLKLRKEGVKLHIPREPYVSYWDDLMKQPDLPELEQPHIDSKEDLALLQYTGGTTGLSKGVMLTHANLVANVEQARAWFHRSRRGAECILAVLPFFHVYGMTAVMNFAILLAAKMILIPKFDLATVLKTVSRLRPTMFPGAPPMYVALINHPDLKKYDIRSIKACISGAAPLPREVQERFEAITGGRLVEGYGLTEASPVTHANPIWGRRKNGSIGLPFPDTEAKVVDSETGEEVPRGEVGELIVRGPQVMRGYWNQPEETDSALRDGWLYTGDMATMDEDGYFYIVERKKDVIVASGFNVYPREVEEVLYEHEAVQECTVAGVPDEYRGETVKAYIVLKEKKDVSAEELEAFCRERLAAFKVPRKYEFRDELPKALTGKVLRRVLVEEEKKRMQETRD